MQAIPIFKSRDDGVDNAIKKELSHKKFQERFAYCFVTHCQISYIKCGGKKQLFLHSFNLPKFIVVALLIVQWLFISLLF